MMAYQNSTVSFEKMLLKCIADEDPLQSMLKWLCERLMEAEVENKLCAEKSEQNKERQGYRSGYRVRRFDTRMGTIYWMVPKIRNGGYIPFFVESKKRSEAALMNVIQEAYVNGTFTRKIDTLAKKAGHRTICLLLQKVKRALKWLPCQKVIFTQ
jgi:transposase-like protein